MKKGILRRGPSKSKSRKKSKVVVKPPEDDYSVEEKILREFDKNMKYGPCIGLNRVERWLRAHKMGLNPPQEIMILLQTDKVQTKCMWDRFK
ncbi:hypothetical protein Fmac_009533 [Flemingia macrophylla]|uniref:DNA polymerase delta subunit 4 n=1 Tax=Flemingia macrophylla TaxID=520843 RepID=A0ABD1N0I2_9FABA